VWIGAAVLLVAFAALQVATLVRARGLRAEAADVDDRTLAFEADVRRRVVELAGAQAALDDARRVLAEDARASSLAADARAHAIADRDAALGELARLQAEVERLFGEILVARQWVDINLLTIAGLDTCLEGVSHFLNQVSVGDTRGAVATAQAAAGTCESAGVPL
jgi:hypothetical protein